MNLEERMEGDYRAAMKARNSDLVETFRVLRAAIKQIRIDRRVDLTDDDVIQVLSKEARKRQEAAAEYEKSGRADLSDKERDEFKVIETYLPQPLREEEVKALLAEAIRETNATDLKAMGAVMKAVMARAKGRADGHLVNRLVREALAPPKPPPV